MLNKVEEAIQDIKLGKVVIVCDDEDRENEGDFVMSADLVSQESINFMVKEGRGLVCVPVSVDIADALDFQLAERQNSQGTDCKFTNSVDAVDVKTGISAAERAYTIKKICSRSATSGDFRKPGHIFPIIAEPGGVLVRAGHTEAAVDLSRLAGLSSAGVICEIMNDDGSMARLPDLKHIAKKFDLKIISIADLIEYRFAQERLVKLEEKTSLPTEFGEFEMYAYSNILDDNIHIALVQGDLKLLSPYVRVHSECFTGDVLGSLKCDCRAQLHASLRMIADAGAGVLLYMKQEGRGIGLVNKMKAYNLQDDGFDTVEANEKLGFKPDLRHYGIGAQILSDLGLSDIKLLTNNPTKVVGISGYGLNVVDRVPIEVIPNDRNRNYLKTKKTKLGHMLDLV